MSNNLFDFFLDLMVLIPIIILVRFMVPKPAVFRAACTIAGMYLLYGFAPRFVPIVFAFWLIVWALQYLSKWGGAQKTRLRFTLGLLPVILLPLAPMFLWKLFPIGFQNTLNEFGMRLFGGLFPDMAWIDFLAGSVIPMGLSFFTFRALDLLLKNYLELLEPISLGRILYYGFFPPILALGPISEYEEVRYEKDIPRIPIAGDVAVGLVRISFGGVKIFLISAIFEAGASALWNNAEAALWAQWTALLLYGMFFYFNFSGYSDVAIGCARVLGIKLKENFDNPFMKKDPHAFWASWHMSLTRWANRYVFTPFGGMRANRQYIAIFMTIMVIALWHGLTWSIFAFGLFHAIIMMAHRYLLNRKQEKQEKVEDNIASLWFKRFCVFTFVSFSIPALILPTRESLIFYAGLFGLGG